MLSLKKTVVAVLALGSSAVFAGAMGPVCTPGNVTVPCENVGWDAGITALYLQPVSHLSDFAIDVSGNLVPVPFAIGNTNTNNNDFDWSWGFLVEASYHFGTGSDLSLNWYHLDGTTNFSLDNVLALPVLALLDPTYTVNNKWDAVNGEFGQFVDVSANKKIRFYGGVQYASIKRSANVYFNGFYYFNTNSTYNGFGPRTGIDFDYVFGNGFGLFAQAATAILVGTSNFNLGPVNLGPNLSASFQSNKTTIVPEFDARLGGAYSYALAQGSITLDAGYMWFNYFNAQNNGILSDTDFSVSGPFVGLKYVGSL